MSIHYHVATGLTGYGPDASDGYEMCTTILDTAQSASDELRRQIDTMADVAQSHADSHDYKNAWDTIKLAEHLDTLACNLDVSRRRQAPLYQNNVSGLIDTMKELLDGHFPQPLDIEDNNRLYVWACGNTECVNPL